jgi:hypothetical protein
MATPTTLPASFTAGQVLTAAEMNGVRGAFRVLQVVSTSKTDTFTSSSSSYVDITGLSVSITPSSTTSKILVLAQISNCNDVGIQNLFLQLVRNTTAINIGDAAGAQTRATSMQESKSVDNQSLAHWSFLDSPSTTSAITYKVQGAQSGAGTFYINRSKGDTSNAAFARTASSITVMEISA